MDIGDLNKRIKVYSHSVINDKDLGTKESGPPILKMEIWAAIQPRTASLLLGREAGTILSKTTHVINIRSKAASEIKKEDYILWTDEFDQLHKFDVDYILPPAGCEITNVYCSEVI